MCSNGVAFLNQIIVSKFNLYIKCELNSLTFQDITSIGYSAIKNFLKREVEDELKLIPKIQAGNDPIQPKVMRNYEF